MRISKKGRYAVILMFDLAVYYAGTPIKLKDVARRQQISEKYLEQIVAALSKGGLVKSIRGFQGGYCLKYRPEEYTIGMILRQTEGDLAPVTYDVNDTLEKQSVIATVWDELEEAINQVVNHITLRDLMDRQSEQLAQYII